MVAHRGLSAEEPENTMRSFRRAVEVGCDLIEMDIHLSKDGVPVVVHDETLDRTTTGRGRVVEHTWAQLRQLEAGRGERIPALEEVIEWAGQGPTWLSLEIKQPAPVSGAQPYEGIAEKVVALVRGTALEKRSVIHSFDHPTIRRVRDAWPGALTAISYGGGTFVDPLALGRAAGASGIHPWWAWASPSVVGAAHAAGMHVHAWGTTQPPLRSETEALVRAGVDSLDANDPRLLRALLDEIGTLPPTTSP